MGSWTMDKVQEALEDEPGLLVDNPGISGSALTLIAPVFCLFFV